MKTLSRVWCVAGTTALSLMASVASANIFAAEETEEPKGMATQMGEYVAGDAFSSLWPYILWGVLAGICVFGVIWGRGKGIDTRSREERMADFQRKMEDDYRKLRER